MTTTPYEFKNSGIPSDALEQSTYWYDRNGRLHVIENMNKFHCIGAIGKLIDAYGAKGLITPLAKALLNRAEAA